MAELRDVATARTSAPRLPRRRTEPVRLRSRLRWVVTMQAPSCRRPAPWRFHIATSRWLPRLRSKGIRHTAGHLNAASRDALRRIPSTSAKLAGAAEGRKALVLHSELRIGESKLMISDFMSSSPAPAGPAVSDSKVQILLDFTDVNELRKKFEALAGSSRASPSAIYATLNSRSKGCLHCRARAEPTSTR